MTVILTFIGIVVFFISLATAGFTAAFKRLVAFAAAGFVIDLSIVMITLLIIVAV